MIESPAARRHLRTVRRASLEALSAEAFAGPVVSTSEALMRYLSVRLAHEPTEQLRVIFLNAKNRLVRDEAMGSGSIDEVPLYPRRILGRALELKAAGLILLHNHPSGDPRPSQDDIRATLRIVEAGRALDIIVHDHVVIASTGWTSFRAQDFM